MANTNNSSDLSSTVPGVLTTAAQSYRGCKHQDFTSAPGFNHVVVAFGIALVIENILLITVIARHRKLHTNTNILVASLAVTDVLVGVQCVSMGSTGLSTGLRPLLQKLHGDLHLFDLTQLFINLCLMFVSLLHVSALAVDRYLFVLWPLRYRQRVTRPRLLAVAAGIWTMGVCYAILPLVFLQGPKYRKSCIITSLPVGFAYVPVGCVYVVCLGIVLYYTVRLVQIARRHRSGHRKKHINLQDLKCKTFPKQRQGFDSESSKSFSAEAENASPVVGLDIKTADITNLRDNNNSAKSPFMTNGLNSVALNAENLKLSTENENPKETSEKSSHVSDIKVDNVQSPHASPTSGLQDNPSRADALQRGSPGKMENTFVVGSDPTASPTTRPGSRSFRQSYTDLDTPEAQPAQISLISVEPIPSIAPGNATPAQANGRLSKRSYTVNTRPAAKLKTTKEENQRLLSRANIKLVKFVLVVLGTFLICTFPAILILSIIKIFNKNILVNSEFAFDALHFIISLNSGMNFVTISYMNRDFRQALIKFVCPCRSKARSEQISVQY